MIPSFIAASSVFVMGDELSSRNPCDISAGSLALLQVKSSKDLLPGVQRAVRGRALLPSQGRGELQAAFQQRELRGLGVRARAVATLLRVFSLRVLALVSPSFPVSFLQPGKSSLRVLRSMGQGEYHHCQLAVCWSHCREIVPRQ